MSLIFILSSIFFLAALAITYWIHNQDQLDIILDADGYPILPLANAPLISVCVPARNEERNIKSCVDSILSQDYPNFELIVLEDRSSDSTAEILQSLSDPNPRLKVLSGSELPPGWVGKTHALAQAADHASPASGGWLCFVDADTLLSSTALTSCFLKAVETNADLFSILTFQVTGSFWEKVVLPLVMTALSVAFSPRKVNDPHRKNAIANGQFIMIKRSVYEAVGRHELIKDQIVEDKALAKLVKSSRFRIILADGKQVARTRMYTSFPGMWEGWTKNIYLGLRDELVLLLLGALGASLLVIAALLLPAWPLLGLFWFAHGGGWMALAVVAESLILWVYLLAVRATIAHRMNIPRWYALTTPLGAGVFAAMMLTSAWKVISRQGVTWRGRKYIPQ